MQQTRQYTNHLAGETSPYLLQHAANPVDWFPWGAEALTLAREQNKPILLSIGYSACHWCHVMAHECFEDPKVAADMNRWFVNIKVDREERPDLDKIYQNAHSLLTQRAGGWPLTVFLTPDQIPFFAGTYFPPEPRHGLPGFSELLAHIDRIYRTRQADIDAQNESLLSALNQTAPPSAAPGRLDATPLDLARNQLQRQFDPENGGFGKAPKFPHPGTLEFLLHHWQRSAAGQEDLTARKMLTLTLERMALGGLNDQIGGGFCRYSTDDQWMIPHFEKMLYDNGPLLALYARLAALTGSALFARTARDTARWVIRGMQSPRGGYYSSLDADSEGEEGRFYVWEQDAVRQLLEADDYAVFSRRFGFDRPANFEGRWYPHCYTRLDTIAQQLARPLSAVREALERSRQILFQAREQRIHPGRDDKILTAWNALMIRGMALAGRLLNEAEFIHSAQRALDFIRQNLWQQGRLLATAKDGRAHLSAYLDDYVFLAAALLELLQVRWRSEDLRFAQQLMEVVLAHFQDNAGGFFFTADDHETLIQRPKPGHDEALPAGNGVALQVLITLAHLSGEQRYLEAAERGLNSFRELMQQSAYACTSLLEALADYLYPGELIILRGTEPQLRDWQQALDRDYRSTRRVFAIPASATQLPELLTARAPRDDGPVAYVCRGTQCLPPLTDLNELLRVTD